MSCVKQEGHRVRHGVLGERKRELVAAINEAPRRSLERTQRFYRLHRELTTARQSHPAIEKWEQRLRESERADAEDAPLFDRELFYPLQSRERLSILIDRYRRLFD
jgi:hypothetical protein